MSGRAWTVVERNALSTDLKTPGIASIGERFEVPSDAFEVFDEERVAFRVAQATLELRERLEAYENERPTPRSMLRMKAATTGTCPICSQVVAS